jgi:hypothetical protein
MADENQQIEGSKEKQKTKPKKAKSKDICFVIMPFGGWGDDYYGTIYIPAIEAAGMEPHRADDLFRPSTIVNDIWSYTKKAKLLLADLTGKNSNVFYELGLAHALAKPVILVAESMEEIPFDLRSLRVITYDKNDPEWGRILRNKLQASIKEVLKSPIEAVLPAFLEIKAGTARVTPHEKELLEIKQELDLLKRAVRSTSLPEPDEVRRHLQPREARERIRHYLSMKMPEDLIIRRLGAMGVPASWVNDEINQILTTRIKRLKTKQTTKRKK